MNKQFLPRIPYGTRDFLPKEAKQKRVIENSLAVLFSRWGYDEVVTPTFEYLETIDVSSGADFGENLFKFFDNTNSILALRPDMTTPMARVAATRLKETNPPLRLFYLTNVFRHEQAQAGRQCEFYQAGVELLGAPGASADAEIIALAIESMRQAGLKDFQIGLGQVGFINGFTEEVAVSTLERQRIKQCIVNRNLVGLGEILTASGLDRETQNIISEIPLLHGGEEVISKVYKVVKNAVSREALDNLADIHRLLTSYGVGQYVKFDLGLIRDFDYYTGMVFEGYTPGLGFPLLGGGRYDNMLATFGVDSPATGFALGIERIMLALERQGITPSNVSKDLYIAWVEGAQAEAISLAAKYRQDGRTVELALAAQQPAEVETIKLAGQYRDVVYVKDNHAK
ncbi:MAG: hisZ [Firmicutes bacterium]|nr:hisZ [Bacillota bacterium]